MVKWKPVLQELQKQEPDDGVNVNALTDWLDALSDTPSQFRDPSPQDLLNHSRRPLQATQGNSLPHPSSPCVTFSCRDQTTKRRPFGPSKGVLYLSGQDLPRLPLSPSPASSRHLQHELSTQPPSPYNHTSSRPPRQRQPLTSHCSGPLPSWNISQKRKMADPVEKDQDLPSKRASRNQRPARYAQVQSSQEQQDIQKTPAQSSPKKKQSRNTNEVAIDEYHADPFTTPIRSSKSSQQNRDQPRREQSPTKIQKSSISMDRISWMANEISPAVRFMTIKDCLSTRQPPRSVIDLWNNYLRPTADGIIPMKLKPRIHEHENTPHKSQVPIANSRYVSGTQDCYLHYHESDLPMLWIQVKYVVTSAGQYRNTRCTEAHWMAKVVHPLLSIVHRLDKFKSIDFELLEVADMTSVNINTFHCPKTKGTGKYLEKKIDGAIGLQLTTKEHDTLMDADIRDGSGNINPVAGDFLKSTPLWNHIEVKRPNTDKAPGVQLGVWGSAEFSKREYEGYDIDMPITATAIDGDYWSIYIVYPEMENDEPVRTIFAGPFPIGNTMNVEGVFEILHYYCTIADWASKEFRPWFRQAIMEKYGHNYTDTW